MSPLLRGVIVTGLLLASTGIPARAQTDRVSAGNSGMAELRKAAAGWERQTGPERQVVDQVCLVPDLPTFLEAIGSWDAHHCFPVLIDDVELTFKFLRAFRPARIVRYPDKGQPIPDEKLWDAAVAATGRSWRTGDADKDAARGDAVPEALGKTPPGVVLAAPESPMLAGAVALAAGRFQPLIKLRAKKHYGDVLSTPEARLFALEIERRVADLIPRYDRLGDGCDFLTLAGDWPYRYQTDKGDNALDDLLGRFPETDARWAFTGRLTGDLKESVYRAMCSLFLQPKSALLFNSYNERDKPWSDYRMNAAAETLRDVVPVTHRSGDRASLTGWHEAFDPINRFGLVLINTHGSPTQFNLPGGPGQSADVPPSEPTAVLMIHSFSAANPNDTNTIAGRWLSQGAFLYYGSVNEPYLQAFRSPAALAALVAAHVPLSAAARQSPPELFGKPWRLMFLGDPLYRIAPRGQARLASWKPVAHWPAYVEYEMPEAGATADLQLVWAIRATLFRLQTALKPQRRIDFPAVLLAIRRADLHGNIRPTYDALLADTLLQANRADTLLDRIGDIPVGERSPFVRQVWEALVLDRLQKLVTKRDLPHAMEVWAEAIATPAPEDFHQQCTVRVSSLADSRQRLTSWRQQLRSAGRAADETPSAKIVADELKRVDEKLKAPSAAR